ncbi:MAG: TRAP transporter substrate-binding protein [Rhodocyclaceae bacterium]
MKIIKAMCFGMAVAGLLQLGVAQAQVREHTIKFAFQNQKEHPQGQGAQKFADLVAQKSGNKIAIKLFAGGTLGGDLQTVSALQGGTIEMTVLNAGLLSGVVKEFAALDLPFLFNNPQEADAVIDGPFGKKLFEKLPEKSLIGLNYWDLGFRSVTNNKRPITKVEDMDGIKLRVLQSPVYIDMFNALGANAVPMPFPEVYTALEQHAVDGQENPATTILASKFYEVQKYFSITRHIYNPQALIISKKLWDQLNADERKIIVDAANEATAFQRKLSRDSDQAAIDALKKNGMQVNEVSAAEMARFRDKVKPVVAKAAQNIGEATVSELNAEIAKARKK